MKRLVFIVILSLSVFVSNAQISATDTLKPGYKAGFKPNRSHFGLSLGSSFATTSGFGSGLTTYITPTFSYDVSKRFRIGGGLSYMNTTLFNVHPYYGSESAAGISTNYSTAMIFVNGSYLVNDRLTIYGSAFKVIPLGENPLPYNPYSPISKNGAQGVNVNVDYRIGENFHIQAGFGYSQGVNPYRASPFYSDPFNQGAFPAFGSGYPGH
jgi:hypothetical protein